VIEPFISAFTLPCACWSKSEGGEKRRWGSTTPLSFAKRRGKKKGARGQFSPHLCLVQRRGKEKGGERKEKKIAGSSHSSLYPKALKGRKKREEPGAANGDHREERGGRRAILPFIKSTNSLPLALRKGKGGEKKIGPC